MKILFSKLVLFNPFSLYKTPEYQLISKVMRFTVLRLDSEHEAKKNLIQEKYLVSTADC